MFLFFQKIRGTSLVPRDCVLQATGAMGKLRPLFEGMSPSKVLVENVVGDMEWEDLTNM